MLNNFIKFRFFNSKIGMWVTDYISEDDIHPFVITITKTTDKEKYSFCITRVLGDDVYVLLEQVMNLIKKNDKLGSTLKIINLGLNCKDEFISGQFELSVKNDSD